MVKLLNLARVVTATVGAGTVTLGAAVPGSLNFAAAGAQDGDTITYTIVEGNNAEIGRGVYGSAGATLTRNVLRSTNANAPIVLAGAAQVFASEAAEDFPGPGLPQGRLSLTSGTSVTITDVAAASVVYYTPAPLRRVPLWNGTALVMVDTGGELSQATTDTTKSPAAVVPNSCYDMFVWDDNGTKRCTRGPPWASDTSRGTGTGTSELDFTTAGLPLNKWAIANGPAAGRGTYVGTIRSDGSSLINMTFGSAAAGGGPAIIGVWNAYNQVWVRTKVSDTTNGSSGWPYASTTVRAVNGSNGNRVSFVCGLQQHALRATYTSHVSTAAVAGAKATVGFGLNVGATPVMDYVNQNTDTAAVSGKFTLSAPGGYGPLLGFNFIQALEAADANSATFDHFSNGNGMQVELFA